jgi:hypothetical protein
VAGEGCFAWDIATSWNSSGAVKAPSESTLVTALAHCRSRWLIADLECLALRHHGRCSLLSTLWVSDELQLEMHAAQVDIALVTDTDY